VDVVVTEVDDEVTVGETAEEIVVVLGEVDEDVVAEDAGVAEEEESQRTRNGLQ